MKSIKTMMIMAVMLFPLLAWGEGDGCDCPGDQPYAGKDECQNNVCDSADVGTYPFVDACGNGVCEEPEASEECCEDETFDSNTHCCVEGNILLKYTGSNACTPATISNSLYMANGTQNIPAFNQVAVVTMVPRREKLFRMNPGTFSSRTFNVIPTFHNSKQSSSCGGGIPSEILNPGSFSVSVGASVRFLSVSMSWSGGGTSFPIYDKSDADPEDGVWKFGKSYKIDEKPNGARLTIAGTEELLYSPYTTSSVSYQNHLVLFNTQKKTRSYDYRVCSMCCE